MKQEARERASIVCVDKKKLLVVYLKDPASQVVRPFPPGGLIETNETPENAALRECWEETGFNVKLTGLAEIADYEFEWGGKLYLCRTHFFPATLAKREPTPPSDTTHLVKVDWINLSSVKDAFSFHSKLRDAVLKITSRFG